MSDERANAFLRMIRHSQRGRLKVYLGYGPGVGKTYQMLQEGHRLADEGIDVVVGYLETHGRADIIKLGEGLETLPRRRQDYHGVPLEEMDVEALLSRKPQVALIDELAHTNTPGSANPKRYQDVQDILAAGIHVITTLNVQHLESLYNLVEKAIGVKVRERLPDSVLAQADQIVDVDLSTEDLQKRLEEGKIYPKERIQTALSNFFIPSNLEKLRELTLRELASQIDLRRREVGEESSEITPDQVMVCLSSRGPNSDQLLRYASRLAGRLNRNWYAVYVQTPSEEATVIDAGTQRLLSETLTLAKQLGAMVFTYKGEDIADTILRFAREYRVGHIIIGYPGRKSFFRRFGRNKDVVGELIQKNLGPTVIIMDTRETPSVSMLKKMSAPPSLPPRSVAESGTSIQQPPRLSSLLSPDRIILWNQPITRIAVLRQLVTGVAASTGLGSIESLMEAVMKREEEGSTFFNEGAAFPHARISGLAGPVVALGLSREGISDVKTEKRIGMIFLILSPAENPDIQVKILGLAGRAALNRSLIHSLNQARSSEEVLEAIRLWESEL
jgi:two-component system, OmpR family, sensor histidine kinase KdpD